MALSWKPGAFAERYPRIAADIGRAHALEAAANGELYESAGTAPEEEIRDETCPPWSEGQGCCGGQACCEPGSCCDLGTCAGCGDVDEEFEGAYPDAERALDEGHALAAALRDIQADPDVEDVAGSFAEAQRLAVAGQLADFYVPTAPARALPDGSSAPERCPICGAEACPTCGCTCECCDSAADRIRSQAQVHADVADPAAE